MSSENSLSTPHIQHPPTPLTPLHTRIRYSHASTPYPERNTANRIMHTQHSYASPHTFTLIKHQHTQMSLLTRIPNDILLHIVLPYFNRSDVRNAAASAKEIITPLRLYQIHDDVALPVWYDCVGLIVVKCACEMTANMICMIRSVTFD